MTTSPLLCQENIYYFTYCSTLYCKCKGTHVSLDVCNKTFVVKWYSSVKQEASKKAFFLFCIGHSAQAVKIPDLNSCLTAEYHFTNLFLRQTSIGTSKYLYNLQFSVGEKSLKNAPVRLAPPILDSNTTRLSHSDGWGLRSQKGLGQQRLGRLLSYT